MMLVVLSIVVFNDMVELVVFVIVLTIESITCSTKPSVLDYPFGTEPVITTL